MPQHGSRDDRLIGLIARNLAPGLAGEAMHALTQLGTIAFAYLLRQWLGRRFGHLAGPDRAGTEPAPHASPAALAPARAPD